MEDQCRILKSEGTYRREGVAGLVCELCHSLLPEGSRTICPNLESGQCATRRVFHRANFHHLRLLDTATGEIFLECPDPGCRYEGRLKNPDLLEDDVERAVLCPDHERLGERVTLSVARTATEVVNGN